jgi:hypothetical protein
MRDASRRDIAGLARITKILDHGGHIRHHHYQSPGETPMPSVRIHIHVAPDHSITGAAPASLPPGPHEVVLQGPYVTAPAVPFRAADIPTDSGPWDDSVSLRREDIYGDAGR